jgi:hypothetical protein
METLAVGAGKLVLAGFCLSIGFWTARKLTSMVDGYLVVYDRRFRRELEDLAQAAQPTVMQ